MAFRIVWSETTLADLRKLVRYIARDDRKVAKRFGDLIVTKVQSFQNFPRIGRIVPEYRDADAAVWFIGPVIRKSPLGKTVLRIDEFVVIEERRFGPPLKTAPPPLLTGGAPPPGAHAKGTRKPSPRSARPSFLGIQLSPPLSCGLRRGSATVLTLRSGEHTRPRVFHVAPSRHGMTGRDGPPRPSHLSAPCRLARESKAPSQLDTRNNLTVMRDPTASTTRGTSPSPESSASKMAHGNSMKSAARETRSCQRR